MWQVLMLLPALQPWARLGAPSPAPRLVCRTRVSAHPVCVGATRGAAATMSTAGAVNDAIAKADDSETILGTVAEQGDRLTPVNIVTALHRIGRIEKRRRASREVILRDKRFELLLDQTVAKSAEFSPRAVTDVLWSCATLHHWPPLLLKPVLTRVAAHLDAAAFEPHHLSILSWSFGTLGCKPVKLLEKLEALAAPRIGEMSPQNCANLLWGFAKLRQPADTLVPALAASLKSSGLIASFKPVEAADLAYGLGMLADAETAGPLLAELSGRARATDALDSFSSRHLVTLLWGFARFGIQPPRGALDEWAAQIRQAHAVQPMLRTDQKNLARSLERLGHEEMVASVLGGGEGEEASMICGPTI